MTRFHKSGQGDEFGARDALHACRKAVAYVGDMHRACTFEAAAGRYGSSTYARTLASRCRSPRIVTRHPPRFRTASQGRPLRLTPLPPHSPSASLPLRLTPPPPHSPSASLPCVSNATNLNSEV